MHRRLAVPLFALLVLALSGCAQESPPLPPTDTVNFTEYDTGYSDDTSYSGSVDTLQDPEMCELTRAMKQLNKRTVEDGYGDDYSSEYESAENIYC